MSPGRSSCSSSMPSPTAFRARSPKPSASLWPWRGAIVARPALLMLDEPAAGLDRFETEKLGERLRQLASSGPGLLLVDHDMALVLTVCDYVHVLDAGRLIASGTPAEIRGNPDVLRSYLGEDPVAIEPSGGAR